MDALLDSAHASRAPHLAPCAWLGACRSTLRSSFRAICSPSMALAAFAANGALRNPAYSSGPRGEHGVGLEPMRWNSVKKTAPCAVLCQLAYNHAIMDLRAYKETLNSLKTPMQGVFVVVLCTVAFVVWLGVLVVITKLLMG